jgi:probable F420-dependent oxidoreductase
VKFDVMVSASRWSEAAHLAKVLEAEGVSGLLFTETAQTPWMSLATVTAAAPSLELSTGVAVAFPRSPMIAELAEETGGRFRLGLGSQVKAHVERRYSAAFDPPGPRLREYVEAVRACFRAFSGQEPLQHHGRYYELSLLPPAWAPRRHAFGVPIDVSAVGPWMCRMAGEVADGVHVHPLHSPTYLRDRLLPTVAEGTARAGRALSDVDLIVPVFVVPGDSEAERAAVLQLVRTQIAFYGSTKNYAFQFDDLGFEGTSRALNDHLKAGNIGAMAATITDDMLDHFAVVGPWDEIADRLVERYGAIASRVAMYTAEASIRSNPDAASRWGEVARAVTAAAPSSQ